MNLENIQINVMYHTVQSHLHVYSEVVSILEAENKMAGSQELGTGEKGEVMLEEYKGSITQHIMIRKSTM